MGPSHRLPIMPLAIPDSKKCEAKKQTKRKEEKEQIYPNNVGQTDRSIPSLPISDREKRAPKGAAQGQPHFSHQSLHTRDASHSCSVSTSHIIVSFVRLLLLTRTGTKKKSGTIITVWSVCICQMLCVCVCVCVTVCVCCVCEQESLHVSLLWLLIS